MGFPHGVGKKLLVDHASLVSLGEGVTHSLLPASLREPFDWCGFGYVSVAKTSHDGERDMYSDSPDLNHIAVFGAKT